MKKILANIYAWSKASIQSTERSRHDFNPYLINGSSCANNQERVRNQELTEKEHVGHDKIHQDKSHTYKNDLLLIYSIPVKIDSLLSGFIGSLWQLLLRRNPAGNQFGIQ